MGNGDRPGFGFQLSPVQGMALAPSSAPNPFGYNLVRPSLIAAAGQLTGPFSAQEYADGEAELRLLHKFFAFASDKNGAAYIKPGRGGLTFDTVRYLTDRNAFFGSIADYRNYLVTATGELDMDATRTVGRGKTQRTLVDRAWLRAKVEPNTGIRHGPWRDCQNVFYAWVRKAYENALGPTIDVPKLIKANKTPALIAALQRVTATSNTAGLPMGGFNARPMKLDSRIRLGTLSEHAVGTAIDVDAGRNAQINQHDWALLEAYTGQPATSNSLRLSTWTSRPGDLYDAISAVNDTFVQNLQNDKVTHGTVAAVQKADKHLKQLKKFQPTKWENGFFALPWDVVEAFHTAGLIWGATFSDVDLHHFEL